MKLLFIRQKPAFLHRVNGKHGRQFRFSAAKEGPLDVVVPITQLVVAAQENGTRQDGRGLFHIRALLPNGDRVLRSEMSSPADLLRQALKIESESLEPGDEERVGADLPDLIRYMPVQPVDDGRNADDAGDADDDSQHSQKGAQFLAGDVAERQAQAFLQFATG